MPQIAHYEIVIIGGGASGILTAWNLRTRHALTCTLIDPSDKPGLGLAYATPSLKNLLNVPAGGMSATPTDPDHFLRWLQHNVASTFTAETFVPRALYGLYLRHLADQAAPRHERATAISCDRTETGFTVSLSNGKTLLAKHVVLCCGHFAPAYLPTIPPHQNFENRYHHNAWADGLFARIASHESVTLIGTGLTMIDVLLRLRENGHRGHITALSRHGILPERHAPIFPLPAPAFCPETVSPTARSYLQAFHKALKAGKDYRAVADSLRPLTNALWIALPDPEKSRFKRHLQRRWDVLRHRVPSHIAEIIEQERSAGTLTIQSGQITSVTLHAGTLTITTPENTLETHHIINCTGPSLNYRHVASPLLQNLLLQGEITSGFNKTGLACTSEGLLINAKGVIAHDLLTVGPARLGTLFESIAIPEIKTQAHTVADYLAQNIR